MVEADHRGATECDAVEGLSGACGNCARAQRREKQHGRHRETSLKRESWVI